ncbi:MAG: hypothetical protein ACI8PD_000939, partial [Nitrospinales bacterium]
MIKICYSLPYLFENLANDFKKNIWVAHCDSFFTIFMGGSPGTSHQSTGACSGNIRDPECFKHRVTSTIRLTIKNRLCSFLIIYTTKNE